MFRIARSKDLIQLKTKYKQYHFSPDELHPNNWGLKQMGHLFCSDQILCLKPERVLEVGAGLNLFFDRHFGSEFEYWMIDDS